MQCASLMVCWHTLQPELSLWIDDVFEHAKIFDKRLFVLEKLGSKYSTKYTEPQLKENATFAQRQLNSMSMWLAKTVSTFAGKRSNSDSHVTIKNICRLVVNYSLLQFEDIASYLLCENISHQWSWPESLSLLWRKRRTGITQSFTIKRKERGTLINFQNQKHVIHWKKNVARF